MRHRFRQHAQHQARIVGLGVGVDDAARQSRIGHILRHVRRPRQEFIGVEPVPLAPAGQEIVDGQAGQEAAPSASARVVREGEALRLDQSGRIAQQAFTLVHGFARQVQVAVLQVAQSAVHQLRRAARGTPGKVALLDQQRPEAAPRRFQQDPGAGDAAADHQQVPFLSHQPGQRGASIAPP
jgi:hypothetical protein